MSVFFVILREASESCSNIAASIIRQRVSNMAGPPNAGNETAQLTVEETDLSVYDRITFEKLHAGLFRGQDTREVNGPVSQWVRDIPRSHAAQQR
jgi:hypothetical protein